MIGRNEKIARQLKDRPRSSGTMTEAMFITFVKGHLRRASRWWKPISETLKKSRVGRGVYLCNVCNEHVPASIVVNGKRKKNILVDHVAPVVDPTTGFSGWDNFINGLYCEEDNLQAICSACHDAKSSEERAVATATRNNKKELPVE